MKDFISRFIVVLFFVPLMAISAGFMVFATLLMDGIAYVAWDSKHVWFSYYVVEFLFPQDEQECVEPLTEDILYQMGFTTMKYEFEIPTYYRRWDLLAYPDDKACITLYHGVYKGLVASGSHKVLKTKEDLIYYLDNPKQHIG